MIMNKLLLLTLSLSLSACGSVVKNDESAEENFSGDNLNAAQQAYYKANLKMHKGMGTIDKDADIAFIQGMIPHHQGAVDMANIILEHGDDEEAKELARNIIKAQEEEIEWMKNWLNDRGLDPLPNQDNHAQMNH